MNKAGEEIVVTDGDARGLTSGLLISVVVTAFAMIPFALAARKESARVGGYGVSRD